MQLLIFRHLFKRPTYYRLSEPKLIYLVDTYLGTFSVGIFDPIDQNRPEYLYKYTFRDSLTRRLLYRKMVTAPLRAMIDSKHVFGDTVVSMSMLWWLWWGRDLYEILMTPISHHDLSPLSPGKLFDWVLHFPSVLQKNLSRPVFIKRLTAWNLIFFQKQ